MVAAVASPISPKGEMTAILSEDFSAFTEGTEDEPMAYEISNTDKSIDTSLTHGLEWKGRGIRSAGGSIKVGHFEDYDYDNWQTVVLQGFLQTPMTDLRMDEGQFAVHFRARSLGAAQDKLHLEVYDPYTTNAVSSDIVGLTAAWQNFEVVLNHPGYGNHLAYLQIASEGEDWQIDDFEIVQDYYELMPPVVHFPRNVSYESFTARWNAVPLATSYLVSVYYYDDGNQEYLLDQEPTTETTMIVTDTEKGFDYYYTVYSVNDKYTSAESEPRKVHVPLTALETPTVLPATDITPDGFTAHWEPSYRAMGYILTLNRQVVATADQYVTVVHEDFNKCEGYADYADYPAPFYGNLDDYTAMSGWSAPNGAVTLDGMLGLDNMWKKWDDISLTSPVMNLSADGGKFTVTLKVKGTKDNVVDVTCGDVVKTHKLTADTEEFDLTFENGNEASQLVFRFTGEGYLYFDDIYVKQTIHAGDTVKEAVGTYKTEVPDAEYTFTGLNGKLGDVYEYSVKAWSYSLDEDGVWGPDVYSESSANQTVVVREFVPVLKEGFSRSESTSPGGGYYSESLYFDAEDHADNLGWTSNSVYEAERAVKFNAKTKTGYLLTPELTFSEEVAGEVKVMFRAQTWKNDNIYVCVEVEGDPSTVQKVDSDVSNNIVDRSEEPFVLTFTNVPSGSKFRFYAEKRSDALHRFFLSDIVILEGATKVEAPSIHSTTYYHRFNDLMAGNDSEVRTIDVVGHECAEAIEIASEANSNFSVKKAEGWDAKKGGRLEISFVPVNAGHKLENLTISSGSYSETILLGGHAKVYAPVVAEASNVENESFTANWEPAPGMDELVLTVYTKEEGDLVSSNLMFTKYIEGKSNNRGVEIFNGTGKTVNLNGWKVRMEANGAGGLTSCEYALPDRDLENGKTLTICNAQFNAVRDIADITIGYQSGGYSNFTTFTGDDALGLFDPEDNLIDILGYESYDCNDLINGVWGTDVTYYRKSDSYDPHPKFYVEEWIKHPMDYCEGYGTHTMDATGLVRKIVKKITLDGNATSANIDGLNASTEYYYALEGHSNGLTTPSSKEATVKTTGTNTVDNVAVEGNVEVEYFNLQGIRIDNPESGNYYIRRQGAKAQKVFVK